MKPALLVIDMQKAFFACDPVTTGSLDGAAEHINAAIALFRSHELPVVCVQHIDASDGLVPGREGFAVSEKLDLVPTDLRIHKQYGNAFNKTPLADDLRKAGVDTVVLTGYCAEYCVLSTCVGARDLDLTAILLRDASASGKPQNVEFVESIYDVISYEALEKALA